MALMRLNSRAKFGPEAQQEQNNFGTLQEIDTFF